MSGKFNTTRRKDCSHHRKFPILGLFEYFDRSGRTSACSEGLVVEGGGDAAQGRALLVQCAIFARRDR
jgi:hypothetical protein